MIDEVETTSIEGLLPGVLAVDTHPTQTEAICSATSNTEPTLLTCHTAVTGTGTTTLLRSISDVVLSTTTESTMVLSGSSDAMSSKTASSGTPISVVPQCFQPATSQPILMMMSPGQMSTSGTPGPPSLLVIGAAVTPNHGYPCVPHTPDMPSQLPLSLVQSTSTPSTPTGVPASNISRFVVTAVREADASVSTNSTSVNNSGIDSSTSAVTTPSGSPGELVSYSLDLSVFYLPARAYENLKIRCFTRQEFNYRKYQDKNIFCF